MPQQRSSSIQTKVALVVSVTFLSILLITTALSVRVEHEQAVEFGVNKARVMGQSFFDGINTMMLTGTLDQKESLRKKLMADDEIRQIQIIQNPGKFASESPPDSRPKDDLDQRALKGETVVHVHSDQGQRLITLLTPIKASSNYIGTNCLTCHVVPENTIMGAIRITYSLAGLDADNNRNLLIDAAINIGLFLLGLTVVFMLMRRIVILPLHDMRATMQLIENNADLGRRLTVRGNCEIGALAGSVNSMLDKFHTSLGKVSETSGQLTLAAERIAAVSEKTATAANAQMAESSHTSRFIEDLKGIAHETNASAEQTSRASIDAEEQSRQGTTMTREAIGGIRELVREIEETSTVIEHLDERSKTVSNVLDVIRDIADQTNLLALNAAIEAARAGDAGRGFAVVADEVRKLANRSHQSTRSIEETVAQLQQEAKMAVDTMRHARSSAEERSNQLESAIASLDQIAARVTDIRKLNTEMAKAIQHQGELADSGSQKIGTISAIAERTAADAMQTRGISEELVTQARELHELVARFKLNPP